MASRGIWSPSPENRSAMEHSVRTAVAATVSLLVARGFGLAETYWAVVTTMVVMQSTLGAALSISGRRLTGTALGAALGAFLATHFGPSVIALGGGIFLAGVICTVLGAANRHLRDHLDRTAYRFAGIALTITMLVVRPISPWVAGLHRFIEVAIGIAVGVLLTLLWPDRPQPAPEPPAAAAR